MYINQIISARYHNVSFIVLRDTIAVIHLGIAVYHCGTPPAIFYVHMADFHVTI